MRRLRRFLSRWHNLVGLLLVAFFIGIALAAPVLAPPEDPDEPATKIVKTEKRIDRTPHGPSSAAPLGTLSNQQSVYHALIWGTRSALVFGLSVTVVTALFGIIVGASSAYFGGWVDNTMMRVTDAFLAFPSIAMVVVFNQLLVITLNNLGAFLMTSGELFQEGEKPLLQVFFEAVNPVMLAFIMFSWMPYARIINAIVLGLKEMDFVSAARALGAGHSRIIFRHLIPNAVSPAVVLAARDVGAMVLLQATFTFIGLGGESLWGEMLVLGRDWVIAPGGNILNYWWVFIPVTLALILFGVGWNLLGDGLNDWLNPREI